MKSIWTDEKARVQYDALVDQAEALFKVPAEIARSEPHVFQQWFYKRQCEAAHLKIEAATLFLTFTTAP